METEKLEIKESLVIVKKLGLIAVLASMLLLNLLLPLAQHFNIMVYSVTLLICYAILGAATLVLYNFKGLVQADKNGLNIKISLFGKSLSEQSYKYDDIDNVSCNVEKHNTKNLKYYDMVFFLMLADGKKLHFSKRLKIKFNLDKKDFRSYQIAVASESMMQMYNFIISNKTRAYYEEHPK